jgi:hypothetical protein
VFLIKIDHEATHGFVVLVIRFQNLERKKKKKSSERAFVIRTVLYYYFLMRIGEKIIMKLRRVNTSVNAVIETARSSM